MSVEKNIVGLMLIIIPVFTVLVLIIMSWQSIPKRCFLDQKTTSNLIIDNLNSCSSLCWSKHDFGQENIVDDCFSINILSTDGITSNSIDDLKQKNSYIKTDFNEIESGKQYKIKIRYDGFNKEIQLYAEEVISKMPISTSYTTSTSTPVTTSTIHASTTTISSGISDLVNRMSTEQLVEQMIMSTPDGSKYKNFYLFRWQITSFNPTPVKIENMEIWPLVATDGEGGLVRRLPKDTTPGRISVREIGNRYKSGSMTLDDIRNHARDISTEMKQYKLNMNLAPVLDVSSSGLMLSQERSFDGNYNNVQVVGEAFIQGLHDEGVIATGKHFPGYGNQDGNTDGGKVTDSRTIQDLENTHLKPYQVLGNQLDAIMMNSIVYTNIDPNNPAVFSPTLINRARQISPNIVLITDSLTGIPPHFGMSFKEMVKKAAANNDILLFSSPDSADSAFSTLVSMINSGEISKELTKEKVARILLLKEKYGLIKTVSSVGTSVQPKIGVIGDSITADGIYSKKLQDLLHQQYPNAEVHNHGHGGDTTIAMLARFDNDILNNPLNYNTVIIQGGVNDICSFLNFQSITEPNLRTMFNLALQKNMKVIVLPVLPWGKYYSVYNSDFCVNSIKDPNEKIEVLKSNTEELNNWIRQQADITVVDLSSLADPSDPSRLNNIYDGGDGLHPNSAGREEIAHLIALQVYGIGN